MDDESYIILDRIIKNKIKFKNKINLKEEVDKFKASIIKVSYELCFNNKSKTALFLNIPRTNVNYLLEKYKIVD